MNKSGPSAGSGMDVIIYHSRKWDHTIRNSLHPLTLSPFSHSSTINTRTHAQILPSRLVAISSSLKSIRILHVYHFYLPAVLTHESIVAWGCPMAYVHSPLPLITTTLHPTSLMIWSVIAEYTRGVWTSYVYKGQMQYTLHKECYYAWCICRTSRHYDDQE